MFGEWALMKQEVDAFEKEITKRLSADGSKKIRVFAVGSPRHFQVVVNAQYHGVQFHKRFLRDIRDESHQFWLEKWDTIQWNQENHIVDGLET